MQPLKYNNILKDLSSSLPLWPVKTRFISLIVQDGGLIGFLFYVELSVDSASDSEEKRKGEVCKDVSSEREG